MIIIEVCQGPDCTGLGGGAALLEMEDLVSNQMGGPTHNCHYQVVPGGCRNLCSMGPNVHLHSLHIHFTKINNPAACRNIMKTILEITPTRTTTTTTHSTSTTIDTTVTPTLPTTPMITLISRRTDRLHWQAQRARARQLRQTTIKRKTR